ncbi:hypothetical protein YC2023_076191 [Brassica napus]
MVVLKKERPLEACPSHSYSLSKEKGESFHLVPDYGDSKHEEKRCLRHGGFKRKSMKEGDVGSDTKKLRSSHVLRSFKELTLVSWL